MALSPKPTSSHWRCNLYKQLTNMYLYLLLFFFCFKKTFLNQWSSAAKFTQTRVHVLGRIFRSGFSVRMLIILKANWLVLIVSRTTVGVRLSDSGCTLDLLTTRKAHQPLAEIHQIPPLLTWAITVGCVFCLVFRKFCNFMGESLQCTQSWLCL